MTQITPEQALDELISLYGVWKDDKILIDTIRAALRQASGLDDPWNAQRHICTCACQVAGCDAVKDKAALSQRVGVTEDELQKILATLKLVDDFVNKPVGFKGEMVYDDAAYKKFMADLEERETAMTKAIKEVLEKHGHLLNGLRIIKGA